MVCSRSSSAELQLVRAQLLGAAAELVAQQTLDQQLQLVDLGIAFAAPRLVCCCSAAVTTSRSICCNVAGSSGRAARSICTPAS